MKKNYIYKKLCENVSCENVVLLQFENSFPHPLTLIKICFFFRLIKQWRQIFLTLVAIGNRKSFDLDFEWSENNAKEMMEIFRSIKKNDPVKKKMKEKFKDISKKEKQNEK